MGTRKLLDCLLVGSFPLKIAAGKGGNVRVIQVNCFLEGAV